MLSIIESGASIINIPVNKELNAFAVLSLGTIISKNTLISVIVNSVFVPSGVMP